jgi:hypothetical protein
MPQESILDTKSYPSPFRVGVKTEFITLIDQQPIFPKHRAQFPNQQFTSKTSPLRSRRKDGALGLTKAKSLPTRGKVCLPAGKGRDGGFD